MSERLALRQSAFAYALIPHNMLLNTLLTAAGVTKTGGAALDDFGDSTLKRGVISDLLA